MPGQSEHTKSKHIYTQKHAKTFHALLNMMTKEQTITHGIPGIS